GKPRLTRNVLAERQQRALAVSSDDVLTWTDEKGRHRVGAFVAGSFAIELSACQQMASKFLGRLKVVERTPRKQLGPRRLAKVSQAFAVSTSRGPGPTKQIDVFMNRDRTLAKLPLRPDECRINLDERQPYLGLLAPPG